MFYRISCLILAAAGFISQIPSPVAAADNAAPELKVVSTFKIGGAGRWDYPTVDPDGNRLYVTRGNHVSVIDTEKGTLVGDITDVQGSHGTAIVRDKNLGFVTSGQENAVAVFDLETLKIKTKIKTAGGSSRNPDAILYDPASKRVFAFCAGGDAVAVDPANLDAPPVAVACGGKLEFGQADGAGHVFVNNEDKSEIDVIDSKSLKVTDKWSIAPVTGPSGLAIDVAHHRLFSVGGNQKMAIVDYQAGKVLTTVAIGSGPDGCAFDPKLGVALSANGRDGTVTVVGEKSAGEFSALQTLTTLRSGRTIADDPKTSRFFIPATIPAEGGGTGEFGIVVVGAAQ
jgi:DNA-binding beta-propeller fold protein YncE